MKLREQEEIIWGYALLGAIGVLDSVFEDGNREHKAAREALAETEDLVEEYHEMLREGDEEIIAIGRRHLYRSLCEAVEKVHAIVLRVS